MVSILHKVTIKQKKTHIIYEYKINKNQPNDPELKRYL